MSNNEKPHTQSSVILTSVENQEIFSISNKKRRNIKLLDRRKEEIVDKTNKSKNTMVFPLSIILIKNPKKFKEIYTKNFSKENRSPINDSKIKLLTSPNRKNSQVKPISFHDNYNFARTDLKFDFKPSRINDIVSKDRIVRKHEYDTINLFNKNSINPLKNLLISNKVKKSYNQNLFLNTKSPLLTSPSRNQNYINLKYSFSRSPYLFITSTEREEKRYFSMAKKDF